MLAIGDGHLYITVYFDSRSVQFRRTSYTFDMSKVEKFFINRKVPNYEDPLYKAIKEVIDWHAAQKAAKVEQELQEALNSLGIKQNEQPARPSE